jgi:hypothetical protein
MANAMAMAKRKANHNNREDNKKKFNPSLFWFPSHNQSSQQQRLVGHVQVD